MAAPKYYQDENGRWRKASGQFARKDLAERWYARYGKPKRKTKKRRLKELAKLAKKRKEAAKKAAATRKRKKREAELAAKKRSEAAKKAAATRKRKKLEAQLAAKKRSEAAKKAAATRKRRKEEAKKQAPPIPVQKKKERKKKERKKAEPKERPRITQVQLAAREVREYLLRFSPDVDIEINRDGTIDGEVRIVAAPADILPDLEDLIPGAPDGTWVQFGGSYEIDEDWRELSRNYKTFPHSNVLAHPQRGQQAVQNVATAIEIDDSMTDSGHRPRYTIIRVYWTPSGERPERKFD